MTGLAEPDYGATISFGLPIEPEDSQYGKYRLDGFAVTDHNTGAWIDQIKAVANSEGLVVFPGVEVTVLGGERNVHLLAIFDPSKGTADVHDFLAQVSITEDKRGSTEALARGDVNEVIDKIALSGGVPLLAHCDST